MASSYYHALGSGQMYYWVGVPDYRKYFEKLSNKKCCEKKERRKILSAVCIHVFVFTSKVF